jgi:hypothetical protein
VISAFAIVAGVLVVSGAYLLRYQPLSVNAGGTTWVDPRSASRVGHFTSPDGVSFTAYRVRYREGRSFSYAMTLHNQGPFPVTITSIGEPECERCTSPLVFEGSSVAPAGGRYQNDRDHAEPFERFIIRPGAFRYVVIETRFDHCESYSPGSGVNLTSIRVAYRTGFLQREVLLPMPYTLEIRFRGSECAGEVGAGD